MTSLSTVICSAMSNSLMTLRHIRGREPTQRIRTPMALRFSRRRRTTSRLKPIRKRTSSALRFQFSVENAYTVRCLMPISMAPQVMSMSTASPILCPSVRPRPRWVAHRPLPSITTATWLGTWSAGICGAAALEVCCGGRENLPLVRGGSSREHDGPGRLVREGRIVVRRRGQLRVACVFPVRFDCHAPYPARPAAASCVRRPCDRPGRPRSTSGNVRSCRSRCHCRCAATSPLAWLRCDDGDASRVLPVAVVQRDHQIQHALRRRRPTRTAGSARTRCRPRRRGTPGAGPGAAQRAHSVSAGAQPAIPIARSR